MSLSGRQDRIEERSAHAALADRCRVIALNQTECGLPEVASPLNFRHFCGEGDKIALTYAMHSQSHLIFERIPAFLEKGEAP